MRDTDRDRVYLQRHIHNFVSDTDKIIKIYNAQREHSHRWVYLCKSVTLCDVVLDPVHLQFHAKVEVFPLVMLATFILGQTLAFDPFPLWYPRILHHGLNDAHAVILKVVVNDHGAHAVLLFRGIQDIFLKVSIKAQHLQEKRVGKNRQTRSYLDSNKNLIWKHKSRHYCTFLSRATWAGMKSLARLWS